MEKQYLDLLADVVTKGFDSSDRTGVGTRSLFGKQLRSHMLFGFPLLTTKKIYWKAVVHELLWFLSGDTNVKYLQDNDIHIWDAWADKEGELGPVYGKQWRSWRTSSGGAIDQIGNVIQQIKKKPHSRRHIVTAWNPEDVDDMAIPPCHTMFQFHVGLHNELHLHLYQRSGDLFLGVPFNIASYSLLLHMVAHVTGHEPGMFIHTLGDAHIYNNHFPMVKTQLGRSMRQSPKLLIKENRKSIDDFRYDDFELVRYDPLPTIKAKVAI